MTQQDFNNAFILLLSGAAKLNQHGELEWKSKHGDFYYISFPTQTPAKAVVRYYWCGGGLYREDEYQDGKLHGKCTAYYFDGTIYKERHYKNGKQHGKEVSWTYNGVKQDEAEWLNGKLINRIIYFKWGYINEPTKY